MEITNPVSTRKVTSVAWMEYNAVGLTEYTTWEVKVGLGDVALHCSARYTEGCWFLGFGLGCALRCLASYTEGFLFP